MSDVELTNIRKTDPNANQVQSHINPAYTNDTDSAKVSLPPPAFDDVAVEVNDDLDDEEENCCSRNVGWMQDTVSEAYETAEPHIWLAFKIILVVLYFVYFGYAMWYEFGDEQSIRLLWITVVVCFFVIVYFVWKFFGKQISAATRCCTQPLRRNSTLISWVVVSILFLIIFVFILVDVFALSKKPNNLVSLAGLAVYVLVMFIFSKNPAKVQWRAVVWGLALQFTLALFILRWDKGYGAFEWIGDRMAEFLAFTDAGSAFMFGSNFYLVFAFKVLPTIVFFSTIISCLYYLGAMQVIVKFIAKGMQVVMGTTAGESLNAAANIFIGQTEAPLVIRPIIGSMTKSELHAIMTGGFATIAGGVLASYIEFGVPANHLISASVMSAPAALAMAKLFYPETERSKTTARDVAKMEKSKELNIIEAASAGASASVTMVACIAANLIAFIALLEMLNTLLSWFGDRVGVDGFTFQLICSYLMYPFAFLMGADSADCLKLGRMIGLKTFINEFIAYQDLGLLIENKKQFDYHVSHGGMWEYSHNNIILMDSATNVTTTLNDGIISDRTVAIATYALCGFANIGSIGIQLGGLSAIAPDRTADLSQVAIRAMIAGNVACFMTACIAGLFYQGD